MNSNSQIQGPHKKSRCRPYEARLLATRASPSRHKIADTVKNSQGEPRPSMGAVAGGKVGVGPDGVLVRVGRGGLVGVGVLGLAQLSRTWITPVIPKAPCSLQKYRKAADGAVNCTPNVLSIGRTVLSHSPVKAVAECPPFTQTKQTDVPQSMVTSFGSKKKLTMFTRVVAAAFGLHGPCAVAVVQGTTRPTTRDHATRDHLWRDTNRSDATPRMLRRNIEHVPSECGAGQP
jgi:hypothetical protein